MQTKEINYQGKRLVYRTAGEGPAVVLLHGFGEDGSVWKAQFGIFPGYKLIVPDLPGSGQSEAIEDMSMEGLADAVKAVIHTEGLLPIPTQSRLLQTPPKEDSSNTQPSLVNAFAKEVGSSQSRPSQLGAPSPEGEGRGEVLIGHSMGGYIALAFAEKYPDDLRGLGLFHSTAFADSDEKKETRQKGIRFIQEHGAVEFLKTATPNLYAPKSKEEHPEWIEEHLAATRNFSADSLVSYYTSMMQRPDRTAVLKQSKVPVLFVMGQHDTAVPLNDGLVQCHLPQIAYIHVLRNAGHMGMIEEPEEAAHILSTFVNENQKTA